MNAIAPARSPAGFWKRYVAYSIDLVLACVALEALSELLFRGFGAGDAAQLQSLLVSLKTQQSMSPDQNVQLVHVFALLWKLTIYSTLAYAAIAGACFALFESSSWQATPGKRMVGIKVVGPDGGRIGRGRAFGRFFAAGLSWATLNIGHVMAAFTAERRALHDFIADTRVENTDPAHPQMPAWGWLIIGAQGLLLVLLVFGAVAAVLSGINGANQI